FAYSGSASAVERCDAIASSLIRAAMITPENAYDFSPVKMQIINSCKIGTAAAEKGENINQAIIDNLKYRNEIANKIPTGNRGALELADLAFQLGFDTYIKK
ncbi:hypothetical protein, partial [Cronobacter sakazakii]